MLRLAGDLRILVMLCNQGGAQDDEFVPALTEALERLELPGVMVELHAELSIEHAARIAVQDIVVFVCSQADGGRDLALKRVRPVRGTPWTSARMLEPAGLLELGYRLYRRRPQGYVLAVGDADVRQPHEGSAQVRARVDRAAAFLEAAIRLRLAA